MFRKHISTPTLVGAALGVASSLGAAPQTEYQQAISDASPLLWYQFNESDGNILNHGSLGSGFDGQVFGEPARALPASTGDTSIGFRRFGWVESLDVSPLTGNPTFSIEAVVRMDPNGSAANWGPFLHWGDGPVPRTGREVYFSVQRNQNNRVYAGFYNAGMREIDNSPTNAWMHVVWTREGGTDSEAGTTLYIDGKPAPVEQDAELNPGFLPASGIDVSSSEFRINRARDFIDSRYFAGAIDELALYDRVLTPKEIAERAALVPPEACEADWDSNNVINAADVGAFLSDYFLDLVNGTLVTDFDGNGAVNAADVGAYLSAYFIDLTNTFCTNSW